MKQEHKTALATLLADYWKSRGMSFDSDWALDYLEKGHAKEIEEERFFVALEGDEVVGSHSVILWVGKRAELRDFFVKPEFRGKKIGEQLYQKAEAFCKEKGVQKIFCFILPDVLDFFLERGFQKEGILKGHAKNGEDLIAVGKAL